MIYKMVQTGPNTQLGGLKLGKIICEYQGSLNEEVIKPPIADATKVNKSITPYKIHAYLIIYLATGNFKSILPIFFPSNNLLNVLGNSSISPLHINSGNFKDPLLIQ